MVVETISVKFKDSILQLHISQSIMLGRKVHMICTGEYFCLEAIVYMIYQEGNLSVQHYISLYL